MGMDNDFYKIKKDEVKDIKYLDDEVHRIVYGEGHETYEKYKLVYFRKNYELNEVIGEVLETYCCNSSHIIEKEQLDKIYDAMFEKLKDCWKKCREREDKKIEETEYEMLERIHIYNSVDILGVIRKLFDFENYYLVYQVCG